MINIDTTIVSALIAGVVSIIVSLGTIWVAKLISKSEKERQERELQRRFTEELYKKRIQAYPAVFRITRQLNDCLKSKEKFTKENLTQISKSLSNWVYDGDASFILSSKAVKAYYALRDVLEAQSDNSSGYLKAHRRRVWEAKIAFHASLKQDVRLLFSED